MDYHQEGVLCYGKGNGEAAKDRSDGNTDTGHVVVFQIC